MDEQRERIYNTLNSLIKEYGADITTDSPMAAFMINSVIQDIKNFCAINYLPEELEHVVIRRVLGQMLQFTVQINGGDSLKVDAMIKSISEGDTSISYDSKLDRGMVIFSFIEESKIYGQDDLYSFRKMRW